MRCPSKVQRFLQEFREEAFKLDAKEVLLFGSAVDGSWHEGSDLDIVVFAEKPCKLLKPCKRFRSF